MAWFGYILDVSSVQTLLSIFQYVEMASIFQELATACLNSTP